MKIRQHRRDERATLLALWERSVRATHLFLSEGDIVFYRPRTEEYLASDSIELFVLADEDDVPAGFMALAGNAIDALFLEPDHQGRGHGRRLVAFAQERLGGSLSVDVNEQNAAARTFYEAQGFRVVASSPVDDMGRPHALLHMRRDAPVGNNT